MIQFAAYRGTSTVSKLIRWQTRSCYSHIAIQFVERLWVEMGHSREKLLNCGDVIEAWDGGVRLVGGLSASHTPGTRVDLFQFNVPLNLTEVQIMAGFLVRQIGKPYDYMAIIRFLTREPVDHWNRKSWFCSELAFEAALTAGRNLLERCAAWEIPPRDIPRSPLLHFVGQEITT